MGSLKVIDPGLYTTIQDAGRFAFSSLGIPQSGVMDTYAYRFANMVLGNDQQEAIIEMTWQGATLLFNEDCQIVVACDLTLPTQYIKRLSAKDWKKNKVDLHKRPCIFMLHKY